MKDPIEISIIFVNYNTSDHLRKCLNSIETNLNSNGIEIIVVDNNSSDRSIEKIKDEYPEIKLFLRDKNDGFGSGCNFGVNHSSGKFLLFLNPDIILLDDSVALLKKYLEANSDCGIVSGLMVDEKDSVIYSFNDFPSYLWEFYHLIGYGYDEKINKLISKKEIADNRIFETEWFHGAFFMISRSDFKLAGGFNENYFIYYEDVEICYKIKSILKKKVICLPEARVYHHTKSSLFDEKTDNIYIFHLQRSKILFIKNYNIFKRIILHFNGLLYVIARIIYLPVWKKYKGRRKEKSYQLLKILKLYLSNSYLYESKYEYIG